MFLRKQFQHLNLLRESLLIFATTGGQTHAVNMQRTFNLFAVKLRERKWETEKRSVRDERENLHKAHLCQNENMHCLQFLCYFLQSMRVNSKMKVYFSLFFLSLSPLSVSYSPCLLFTLTLFLLCTDIKDDERFKLKLEIEKIKQ